MLQSKPELDSMAHREEDLHFQVARSLDADPELLPYLPELFMDMEELGAEVEQIVDVIRPLDLPRGSRVLDLGCGKGAVALALADIFGHHVDGYDATWEFVEHASRKAYRLGLDDRCRFEQADVRDVVERARDYDVVCILSLGPVLGDPGQTIGSLRRTVETGGYMFIDDGYLRDATDKVPGYEDYQDHESALRLLQSHGDRMIEDIPCDPHRLKEWNERATFAIERRAAELAERQPSLREALQGYVENQRRETELLTGPIVPALWVLQRV
jgi:SAM-dependent methyltransferase